MNSDGPAPHQGVSLREIAGEAFANLRAQGRRSILALLGIMIGTASIVAMLNIGHNAQLETLKLFVNMGVDMLQVRASPTGQAPARLDRTLVEQLPGRDPDILLATPMATGRLPVSAGAQQADLGIIAMPPALAAMARLPLRRGRLLGTIDDCGLVALVGDGAAQKLSAPGAQLLPGSRLGVGAYVFTVVGILGPTVMESLNPTDYNDAVFIPLACARRALPGPDPNVAMIRLRPGVDADAVGARVSAALANPASAIQIVNARLIIKTMNEQKAVHTRMLAAIGAISLLVGGIGVMNVMLMSVMERRREIGLRAAIGATPRDLRTMFLVESGVLAVLGGAVGALLGVLAAFVAARSSGWTFSLALYVLPLGPGIAGLVGLAFGLYPAITAARLDPIEALRAE
ncbi:ABC transporter permease [Sphingomonas oligophenolica]|uniref:ABC transporter permease n=1 Tax=Sphingomonas oligophenolica TaxID=301154 RepID=A0ABU9Y1M4_9SPHN